MSEMGRRFRKATIRDVARHAGVSTTTVSVFVSGRESVCSLETGQRIRAAVAALNYTPSSLISGAQTNVMRTIGVCLPSPLDPVVRYGSSFFERLWRGITAEADDADYSLLHYPKSAREGPRIEPFLDGRVDGVLFHTHESARPARVASAGMATVLLERALDIPEGCGAVCADEKATVHAALTHLWDLGHQRIAHLAGPVQQVSSGKPSDPPDDVAEQRLLAFTEAMRARNTFREEYLLFAGFWRPERLGDAITQLMEMAEPPTAIFCANDILAVALIQAVQERGWRVPDDLAVVGVDDSAAARTSDPPLTSVDIHLEQVGRESIRCVLRLMEGAPLESCRVTLPVAKLIARGSTASKRPPGPQ